MVDLDNVTGTQSGGMEVIQGRDGVMVLAPITLPGQQAELEHYDRDQPSSMIVAAGLSEAELHARTASLMNTIESRTAGMQPINIGSQELSGEMIQVTGLHVGLDLQHPFQIGHLGGTQWRVNAGQVRWEQRMPRGEEEYDVVPRIVELPAKDVDLYEGFIWVQMSIAPESAFPYGYLVSNVAIGTGRSFAQQPPSRELVPDVDEGTGQDIYRTVWSPGMMYVPIAYVHSPGASGGPYRIRYARGAANISFFSNGGYGPGLPQI